MDNKIIYSSRSMDLRCGMVDVAVDPNNVKRDLGNGIDIKNENFENDNKAIEAFIVNGITKAKQMLAIDNVTTVIGAVTESFCNDKFFGSHVRTHPGIIVGSFVTYILNSRVPVGHRYPLARHDKNVLAKVELTTGRIWYHRGLMESFINYGTPSRRREGTRAQRKENIRSIENLYAAIIMPAIHGWSRRLAYMILDGEFDNLGFKEGSMNTESYTKDLLNDRLYTFSEDHQENKLWMAEAFGDYVIELLCGGEFKIRSPIRVKLDEGVWKVGDYHPADYIIVDRSFGGENPTEREYRLHEEQVYEIYESKSWPKIAIDKKRLLSEVPPNLPTALIGELDTVRRRMSLIPAAQKCMGAIFWSLVHLGCMPLSYYHSNRRNVGPSGQAAPAPMEKHPGKEDGTLLERDEGG